MTKEAKIYSGEKTVSSIRGAGKTEQNCKRLNCCKRMKLKHSLTPHLKINSNWVKNLHVRPDTVKPLEGSTGTTLADKNHRKYFLFLLLE